MVASSRTSAPPSCSRRTRYRVRDGFPAALGPDILRNVPDGGVIPLGTGDNGFGDGNDIPVPQGETVLLRGQQDALRDDGGQVVSLADDGAADSTGYGTDSSDILIHMDEFLSGALSEGPQT